MAAYGVRRRLIDVALPLRRTYRRLVGRVTIGIRGIVLDERGRVLLVRHGYGDQQWFLPGGGVTRGESLTGALRREIREETGLEVVADDGRLRLHGVYSASEGGSDHVAVFVVPPDAWSGELATEGTHVEIRRARFVPPHEPPEATSAGTRRRLLELRGERPPTFQW